MIRNTTIRPTLGYIRRISTYHQASPGDIEAIIKEIKVMTGVTADVLNLDESLITLPPKQPIPDVVLRTDLIPKQRTKVVL